MTRVSPEVRRAQKRQAQEAVELERKIAAAEFKLKLPHLLLLLAARIRPFGEAIVKPNGEDGYHVEYRFHEHPLENVSFGTATDKWAVDMLNETIAGLEAEVHAREEKLKTAREGWAAMTPEQQKAMIDLGIARKP